MPSADWVYVKIKGKDSWCNDAIQYTLTASIDSGDRDTDEDGFIDSEDDCDTVQGTSIFDRKGCIDQILTAIQILKLGGAQIMEQMPLRTNQLSGKILTMMGLATM